MQKLNINILLIALSSALALTACNSGTSSSPAPTPSPIPTPSPSPTPTPSPSPTPTPVSSESGVYVLSSSVLSATYSISPSTNAWVNFTSGISGRQFFVAAVASESVAFLVSTDTNSNNINQGEQTTVNYGTYSTTGVQVVGNATSLPVLVNNTGPTNAATYTISLPAISANQIASNGINAVVVAPVTASVVGNNHTPVTATATAYNLYTISVTGIPVTFAGYYNLNGVYTAVLSGQTQSQARVFFVNGMYYAYNITANNQLLQSKDGITWQQITNNTVLNTNATYLSDIVQVSGSVYAALDEDGGLYLGSSPANLTYIQATSSLGYIASAGNGTLFVVTDRSSTSAANLNAYTPTAAQLGSAVAVSSAFTAMPYSLVFAGGKIYSVKPTGADTLYPLTVTGSVISQQVTPASTVTSSGTVAGNLTAEGGFLAIGSNVLAINSDTSLNAPGALASISAVASNGAATYNNLPTGSGVLFSAFAGNTKSYMIVATNGDVLLSSANGFVQATTVLNPASGNGANLSYLVTNGTSYLSSDGTNLYYTTDNGTTWTAITPATAGATNGYLAVATAANGLYYINVTNSSGNLTNGLYQTATPQILSTWVKVNNIPVQAQKTYWDGTYYVLTNGSDDVGVYDPATGQTINYAGVLPQNVVNLFGPYNVGYNGSTYALAQVYSNYLWTSPNLIGGISGWTQNTATFTGVNGVALTNETFLGPLMWTGKVWVAIGATENIYTASVPTLFALSSYISNTGTTTAVNGLGIGLF